MPRTPKRDDPAMVSVHKLWKQKRTEGWTMQHLGERMGYPKESARKSVSQFLKSRRPMAYTLRRFADAVGADLSEFTPFQDAQMPDEKPLETKEPATQKKVLPYDPIQAAMRSHEHARRTIIGVLESYNSNYDALAEAIQNSMDALEDAHLAKLPGPFLLEITIDLKANAISIFDTGIGMTQEQICEAFAPSATFKNAEFAKAFIGKRGDKHCYRGYKGVGLTFLAYGTDDIQIQSRQNGSLVKGRMRSGRKWAEGQRDTAPMLETDGTPTPLDKQHKRGTYLRVHFSASTRPHSLSQMGGSIEVWEAIVRTRTAAGQVLIGRDEVVPIKVKLKLINKDGLEQTKNIKPLFYFPHEVVRNPAFRFLDVGKYYRDYPGIADHAAENRRQDAVYLTWTSEEIKKQIGKTADEFEKELKEFTPELYAFRPYHAPVWTELNEVATGQKRAHFFAPGLVIAVDRQRMADVFPIRASRSELLAQNVFVLVHFDHAKPDQGRKTLQSQAMDLAQQAADAATQYLLQQTGLLKPAGEKTTASQRKIEKDHEDWVDNVKAHAKEEPLAIPPVTYASSPLTEQDVVGIFNQLAALGVFPGMKILATSAQATYDCYVQFDCKRQIDRLRYGGLDDNPLGLSTDVLAPTDDEFTTKGLTLEFKNNLDGLIDDLNDPRKGKTFARIDICVCWSVIERQHHGYELTEITESNLHERRFPGITHILRKDAESHLIQVVLLKHVADQIEAGHVKLAKPQPPK